MAHQLITEPVVLAHPQVHPYVEHATGVAPIDAALTPWDVERLVDAGVHVVHVHFGFEMIAPGDMDRWIADVRGAGIGLVHTVHDIDNPHLVDQRAFHETIGGLVGGADRVLTLTRTAAESVARRWGRSADIVAHPHVVPIEISDEFGESAHPSSGVYVHAATVRPNLDIDLIERIGQVAEIVGGLRIHVRESAGDTAVARLCDVGRLPGVNVDVEPRLSDAQLWSRIRGARVVALPYRWGTHSGLLEAARDLGRAAVAPPIGGLIDQGAHQLGADLAATIRTAIDRPFNVSPAARRRQSEASIALHRACYRSLAGVSR